MQSIDLSLLKMPSEVFAVRMNLCMIMGGRCRERRRRKNSQSRRYACVHLYIYHIATDSLRFTDG